MSDHEALPGGRSRRGTCAVSAAHPLAELISQALEGAPEREREGVGKYISGMNETELKVLRIAMDSLGSSFDLAKSSGYLKWKTRKM